MPSMIGILMSVSSRSNCPFSFTSTSSASAPSAVAVTVWPSRASARETSARTDSSSSASRIRATMTSAQAGDGVAAGEEAHHDVACVRRRGGEAAPERQAGARLQHRLHRHRRPGVDLVARGVLHGKSQARHIHGHVGVADDDALDHNHWHVVVDVVGDLDIGEAQAAQIDLHTERAIERRHLWGMPHDVLAPGEQRRDRADQDQKDRRQRAERTPLLLLAQQRPPAADRWATGVRSRDTTVARLRHQRRGIAGRNGDFGQRGVVAFAKRIGKGRNVAARRREDLALHGLLFVRLGHRARIVDDRDFGNRNLVRNFGRELGLEGGNFAVGGLSVGLGGAVGDHLPVRLFLLGVRRYEPLVLAACASHRPACCADRRNRDLIGRRAVGAGNQHERFAHTNKIVLRP